MSGRCTRSLACWISGGPGYPPETAESINSEAQEAQRTMIFPRPSDAVRREGHSVNDRSGQSFLYPQAARAETRSITMAFSEATKELEA